MRGGHRQTIDSNIRGLHAFSKCRVGTTLISSFASARKARKVHLFRDFLSVAGAGYSLSSDARALQEAPTYFDSGDES